MDARMDAAIAGRLHDTLTSVCAWLWEPVAKTGWLDWRGFWSWSVLDDRFLVGYFLPLVPVLLLWPRRHLRAGVILTGHVFLAYAFGALFVPLWLATCATFYWLSERFAVDCRRKDVRPWWPPLAAGTCIAVGYLLALKLAEIRIPSELNLWLYEHAPWLFPLGGYKAPWDLFVALTEGKVRSGPPQLFKAAFFAPQVNGLTIFTIRMIHYFSELKRDTIPRHERTLTNFLAFASFGPVLLQGPIERFADFQAGLARCGQRPRWRDAAAGFYRIGLGVFKRLLCLWYLIPYLVRVILAEGYYTAPEKMQSYAVLFLTAHVQVLVIYLDFSGYSDVAIGLARLVGYRPVENFHRPWLATSLTDMWRRWHITFSFILRDYVFMPLVRRRWRAVSSLVVTFVVCGALHNLRPSYILWGVLMGLMVAVNQRWARWMRSLDRHPQRRLSAVRRAWLRLHPLPQLCAWAVTINAFSLSGLICLGGTGGLRVLFELIRRPLLWLLCACGVPGLDPP